MVCYTTIFGPYDTLVDPPFSSIEMVCFTNQEGLRSNYWKLVHVDIPSDSLDSQIRLARRFKILPQEYLPHSDCWIWVDANLKLRTDPARLAEFLGAHDLSTFRYPSTWGPRDCLYQEAEACILRQKDFPTVIRAQIARYRSMGYPENIGLVETSILVRRNTSRCRRFNELWWKELSEGSRRDQISFPYVSWFLGFDYGIIPGCRTDNEFSIWEPHQQHVYDDSFDQHNRIPKG
jgi:hypothetical protein